MHGVDFVSIESFPLLSGLPQSGFPCGPFWFIIYWYCESLWWIVLKDSFAEYFIIEKDKVVSWFTSIEDKLIALQVPTLWSSVL